MPVARLFSPQIDHGVSAFRQQVIKLDEGDSGTAQTIDLIRQLVQRGVVDPNIRGLATQIMRSAQLQGWDEVATLRAVFDWVRQNFTFVRDPLGVTHGIEYLQPAADILASRAGDCDDLNAILLPSLLGSLGVPTRLVTVSTDADSPETYSHVYMQALADGSWVSLDLARPDASVGLEPQTWFKRKTWDITGGDSNMNGCGCQNSGMGGIRPFAPFRSVRRGMGDASTVSAILSAAPQIEAGAAQIVAAANPITPVYGVPAGAAPGLAVSASSSSTWLLIAGLGVLGLFALGRKRN